MENNAYFSPIDIMNAALATPLPKDGRVKMGQTLHSCDAKEFFMNCFVDIVIYDLELQKILNSIYLVADETENLIYSIFDQMYEIDSVNKYKTSYGILLAVRESTLSLLKNNHAFAEHFEQHHAETTPTYVNISNWFDYRKIFEKKVTYFLGIKKEEENIFFHSPRVRFQIPRRLFATDRPALRKAD